MIRFRLIAMAVFSLRQAIAAALYGLLLVTATQAALHSEAAAIIAVPAPAPAPVVPRPAVPAPAPAPKKPLTLHEKVVAQLRAAGHYGAISGLLDSLGENAIIQAGTTLFAPDDGAFDGLNMNSTSLLTTTLDYHVATAVYNYRALSNLPLNSTIPTAAPNVVIVVTSTGTNGLRLDDVTISDPDIYNDNQIAVQGISSVFNTAKYNKGVVPPQPSPVGVPAPAPGLITTPTAPKTASPEGDGSDAAIVVATAARTVFLIASVTLLLSLL